MAGSTLTVKVLSDTSGFTSGMQAASGQADTLKSKLGGVGKALGAMALAAGAAVGVQFLKGSITEAREAEKVMAQTAAGIRSTGGAANVTAGQVENLAGKLSEMAGVDDELIQTGANMLLTFTNVKNAAGAGNNVFDQATEAALNLSAKGFGSMESASVMMGKALNDPIKGITALGRAGVTFTEQQKEQIRTLTESGDVLGAQKIILGEVQKQVGGAAAAADPMDKLKVSVGNLQESVGSALVPVLEKLVPILTNVAQWFERNADVIVPVVAVLGTFAGIVWAIIAAQKAWTAVQAAFNIVMAANPIVLIILGIAALIAAIVLLFTKVKWFRDAVGAVWNAIKVAAEAVWNAIKAVITFVIDAIVWYFTTYFNVIKFIVTTVFNAIKWVIETTINIVKKIIEGGVEFVLRIWRGITKIVDVVGDVFNKVKDTVAGIVGWFTDLGKNIVEGLWNGIKSMAGWIADKVKELAGKILGPFKKVLGIDSPSTVFAGYGRDIVRGLAKGISGNAGLAQRAVSDLGSSLTGPSLTAPGMVAAAGGGSVASSAPNVTLNLTASGVDPYRLGRVVLEEAAWALRSTGR